MKTAAAYLRVSTEKQDEYSLDSQLKLIRDYAARNDILVPDDLVFIDDGISGRSAEKRPAFQRMIGLAKAAERTFELILVWKYSRFARNQEESIVYKSMLAREGVEVVSISEPLAEGPFGSLIERILEWMDEFYSIRLSGEVRRGMAEKVSRGEIVTPPSYGYDVRDGKYVPNDDAETVRRIFRETLAGVGAQSLARQLGAEGVRTRRGNLPDNRWIDYILRNPVYIGQLRWSRDGKSGYQRGGDLSKSYLTAGHYEPIIDRETWDAVQEHLARAAAGRRPYERREQPVEWMLKGLVRCEACGATLVYVAHKHCPSMQCHRYARGQCATSHALSIAKADRLVIGGLEACCESLTFPIAPRPEAAAPAPDRSRQLAAERAKLRRVAEAYEAGVYSLAEFAERKAAIEAAISDLQAETARSSSPAVSPAAYRDRVLSVLDLIKSPDATEAEKNAALKSVLSYIVYDKPNARLELYFYV